MGSIRGNRMTLPGGRLDDFGLHQALIDIVACFISANGVSLTISYSIGKELVESAIICLCQTKGVILVSGEDDVFRAIATDSYPKGEYVARLVANRMFRACLQINEFGAILFLQRLRASNAAEASSLLLPLFGVGPKFVENYCLLAGIE
jgi:hypothetical protein